MFIYLNLKIVIGKKEIRKFCLEVADHRCAMILRAVN